MAWLLRQGEVLASVDVASATLERVRGFAGREAGNGALLLAPARTAHTIGAHRPLDVAHLDSTLKVLSMTRLAPLRVARPHRHGVAVLLVEAGAFERWRLQVGDQLEVKS
jgi:uncharacterized membrane protein (UPF0127 family)